MAPLLPNFSTATFQPREPIDNPYHPLKPGTIYVYEGEPANNKVEGEESSRFAVTYDTKNIAGIAATVARETSWADGFLQEDTNDWFAQDTNGNVWYLGEATTAFEYDDDGNFIGTNNNGAWKAGVNGALPGYIMPANPQVGNNYYQEFAPRDRAVDQATVISRNRTLSTEFGTQHDVLQTQEFTDITPGVFEYKYYAPNIGLVLVEELDESGQPEFIVELESITSVKPEFFSSGQGTRGNDAIDGNNRSNVLRGFQGDDLLQGLDGNDRLLGSAGNDFLVGGQGKDVLKGGDGEDILIGGTGVDTLQGGKDRDQFVFRTLKDRGDYIKDFTAQDVMVLVEIFDAGNYSSSNPFRDYLRLEQVGSATVVRIDADGDAGAKPFKVLATLQNTKASSLSAANFVL